MREFRVKNTLFSKRLKVLRRNLGYKNAESFALQHHFAVDTYKEWEVKGHTPTLNNLLILSDIFHVSLDYLLGRSDFLHVENEGIQEITGLSERSIEVLRYIRTAKTPEFVIDLSNTEGYNSVIIDMINELIEDSEESVLRAREYNEKDPGVYPIDSIFSQIFEYLYSDSAKIEDNEHQFLKFNIGYQDIIESGTALFGEKRLRTIENYLHFLKTERTELTKSDIRIILSSEGYKIYKPGITTDIFEKHNQFCSVLYSREDKQYFFVRYAENESQEIETQIVINEEPDKKLTIAHLIDAANAMCK